MLTSRQLTRVLYTSVFAALAIPISLHADINGFGDFSGFTINQSDGAGAPSASAGVLQLTNHGNLEARSIFYNTPQNMSQFTASFTYKALNGFGGSNSGATFAIQNSPAGKNALGGTGGGLGYSAIPNSIAVSLGIGANDDGLSSSTLFKNGNTAAGTVSTSPVNLFSGNPINVSLTYNGTTLHESLQDTVTLAIYSVDYFINIPSTIGSNTAYAGFTASTHLINNAPSQYFSNFQFTGVPEPASILTLLAGSLLFLRRPRR